jgi:DNA-binding transcriptional MerR regulator
MRVSELAERVGVTREVVRYYTRLGLIKADKCSNGYHNYDHHGLRQLKFIGKAKTLGFTLK